MSSERGEQVADEPVGGALDGRSDRDEQQLTRPLLDMWERGGGELEIRQLSTHLGEVTDRKRGPNVAEVVVEVDVAESVHDRGRLRDLAAVGENARKHDGPGGRHELRALEAPKTGRHLVEATLLQSGGE